ncbi:DUF1579 family protein [Maricaulis parjimensis]|uniref:DUF1579 family protein n=1 Tax=Maricaulis parjimensis TaxID=144023 RepID=UPI00193AD32F
MRRSWGEEARQEMAQLAPLAGDWVVTEQDYGQDGNWHTAETRYRETTRFLLDGMALRIDPAERPAKPWRLETTIQYDQNRDVFRLVALDDTWGNLDVFEGDFDADGHLSVTNLRVDTPYVSPDGSRTHFRLTFILTDNDHNSLVIESTGDGGETWRPFQRLDRVRFGSEAH